MTCGWVLWVHRTPKLLVHWLILGNGTEAVILSNGDDPQFTKDYILYFSDYFCKEPKNDR